MKQYQVTGRMVALHGGIVQLTAAQADARRHCTRPVEGKRNLFHVTGECQFKHGEQFRWDGDVPKALAVDLAELEDERKRQAAEAEQRAKALQEFITAWRAADAARADQLPSPEEGSAALKSAVTAEEIRAAAAQG